MLGLYRDSGSTEPLFLVRRGNGAMVQISGLLNEVLSDIDGRRHSSMIAARLTEARGRRLSAANVDYLIDHKLRPLGLVAAPEGQTPTVYTAPSQPALLALATRTGVIPPRIVWALTGVLQPLFRVPVLVAVLGAVALFDAWLFLAHGFDQGIEEVLRRPVLVLVILFVTVLGGAFHELGHATACRYGGAKPGVIGVGLYLIWPAFYNDLTDSYRLGRTGRLRADLGGVYFNAVLVAATAATYGITGFEPLLVVILAQHLVVLQQFLPFLRLDGYYVVSDLTGVPDLFGRIRPVLAGLIPGRRQSILTDLRPGARRAVVGWVLLTVPVLAFTLGVLAVRLPGIIDAGWASLVVQIRLVEAAWSAGSWTGVALGLVQGSGLVLPAVGAGLTAARVVSAGRARLRRRSTPATPATPADQGDGPCRDGGLLLPRSDGFDV